MSSSVPVAVLERKRDCFLDDTQLLFSQEPARADNAFYLGGYAIEFGLKARICGTLRWKEYPPDSGLKKLLQIHDLDDLLLLTGLSARDFDGAWDQCKVWSVEARYNPEKSAEESANFLDAVRKVVEKLKSDE
ncbi:MAG: hypothetical protein NTZ56_18540 [Acidobacteria bacterium]|nr:hypothetical protein [Acidobacteriota bacterium]